MIRGRGFTLIELLVVVGIFLIVGAVALPSLGKFSLASQLDTEAAQLMQAMRLARERALVGLGGAEHGVCFESLAGQARYILYRGLSCDTRAVEFDRVIVLPAVISLVVNWPAGDLHFTLAGRPTRVGLVRLEHQTGGASTITVNATGLVEIGRFFNPIDVDVEQVDRFLLE